MLRKRVGRMSEKKYSAGIVSQSFWFNEMKQFLNMKREDIDNNRIKEIIICENLFGAPNEYRAKRMYGYLSNRANNIEKPLLDIFFVSNLGTQKIINLISIIRKDRLFFEFLYEVYREKIIFGAETLEISDVRTFFNNKESQDESLAAWKDSTKRRVQSAYISFMTDANLLRIEGKRGLVTPPILDLSLEQYLYTNGESTFVRAITGEY